MYIYTSIYHYIYLYPYVLILFEIVILKVCPKLPNPVFLILFRFEDMSYNSRFCTQPFLL